MIRKIQYNRVLHEFQYIELQCGKVLLIEVIYEAEEVSQVLDKIDYVSTQYIIREVEM